MRRILIKKVMAGLAVFAGLCGLNGDCAEAAAVVAAYQKVYSMNFEVYRPDGLPSGWYATFDGYPVAQVSPNHWVYGEVGRQGVLVPTKVAVGAVVPMDVPQLARVAVSLWRSRMLETREFQHVLGYGVDNMAVLDDPMAYTPLAWKTGEAGLYIWTGDRWHHVVPAGGQSTAQAFAAKHPYIVRTLYEKDALWTRSDTQELADQARAWGCLWRGSVSYVSRLGYPGDDTGQASYSAGGPGGVPGTGTVPDGGQWDIGGDGGTGGGGTGGGGWDVGGGGGTGSGGGSGWDTGSPGSTPTPGDGNSPGETPGGGWDK